MNERPLAYESLKSVLQYMEPNLRFKLALRIPSIASTEKAVPLKINKLHFKPYQIIVNKTAYQLGTYLHYPPGVEPLQKHLTHNSEGGVPYDLDQFGFKDCSQEDIITPGDVVINDEFGRRRGPMVEQEEKYLEHLLSFYEAVMAERMGVEIDPKWRVHRSYEFTINYETEKLKKQIDHLKVLLAPVYCRRSNTAPLYSTMVQLTVTDPNKKKQISRKAGDTKLYEIQKELATRLFGNRKTVFVRHLDIGFWPSSSLRMVIRLPPGFQIKVREVSTVNTANLLCDAIKPLLHSSSYPLERFQFTTSVIYPQMHPTIRNAKQLDFGYHIYFGARTDEKIFTFLSFSNQIKSLSINRFTPDEHISILRNWIENRREVGTCFISKFEKENEEEQEPDAIIIEIFAKCKELLNGYDAGERSIKVTMSESSEVKLSYMPLEKQEGHDAQWELTIEVVAV